MMDPGEQLLNWTMTNGQLSRVSKPYMRLPKNYRGDEEFS